MGAKEGRYYGRIRAYKGTPSWALTFAFLFSVILSCVATAYVTSISPDVRAYLSNKKETDLAAISADSDKSRRTVEGLLSLVGADSAQITKLSDALSVLTREREDLARQILALKEQAETVKTCQIELESCKTYRRR